MRLCDSDDDQKEGSVDNGTLDESLNGYEKEDEEHEDCEADDESDSLEGVENLFDEEDELNEAYGGFKGEDQWLNRVRKHEVENMKIPFPKV